MIQAFGDRVIMNSCRSLFGFQASVVGIKTLNLNLSSNHGVPSVKFRRGPVSKENAVVRLSLFTGR